MWEIRIDSLHAGGETTIVFKMRESPAKCGRLGRSAYKNANVKMKVGIIVEIN